MRLFFIIVSILFTSSTYAFNWDRCARKWIDKSSWAGEGVFTSTSSFFSSTGECSMLGLSEHDKRVFIAHNYEFIKIDFVRGDGEYSRTFAKMHGCSIIGQRHYSTLMKFKFVALTNTESEGNLEKTFIFLENPFLEDLTLKKDCTAISPS